MRLIDAVNSSRERDHLLTPTKIHNFKLTDSYSNEARDISTLLSIHPSKLDFIHLPNLEKGSKIRTEDFTKRPDELATSYISQCYPTVPISVQQSGLAVGLSAAPGSDSIPW